MLTRIRNQSADLELAAEVQDGDFSSMQYQCRSMFTMKKELRKIELNIQSCSQV